MANNEQEWKGGRNEVSEENIGEIIASIDAREIEGKKEEHHEEESQKSQKVVRRGKEAYKEFIKQLDFLGSKFSIPHKVYERIFGTDRIIEIDIPVLLEQKSRGKDIIKIFTGFWVEHDNLLGPYLGEINFLPQVNVEEARGLAALSTLKSALLDLPFGGAAGAVAVNPSLLNNKETERLARSYIKGMFRFLDFDKDIVSSGSGITENSISFMYDECKKSVKNMPKETNKEEVKIKEKKKRGIEKKKDFKENILGKLFQDGGLRARNQAIASGILLMFDELLKQQDISRLPGVERHEDIIKKSPREMTIAFHGFNQLEQELAFMLFNAGYKIAAISDSFGAVASAEGINPADAVRWQKNHRSVAGLPRVSRVRNEQLPKIKVEVLIIGSGNNNIIDREIAGKIKANIVIELQDVMTNDAMDYLKSAGKIVLPYILTSCSMRLVNYLEWLQNKENKFFSQKEIDNKIEEKIFDLFTRVSRTAKNDSLDLKDAAFMVAIQKLSEKVS